MRQSSEIASTKLLLAQAVLGAALSLGCNLITGADGFVFDRPAPTGGAGGSTGGTGGAPCVDPAADCAASGECAVAACVMGQCALEPMDANSPAASQTADDCALRRCDGKGGITSTLDEADFADDGNDCTLDACAMDGTTGHEPVAAGTACATAGGKVCDGAGACVECLDNDGCVPPELCGGASVATQCGCSSLCATLWAFSAGDGADQLATGIAVDSDGSILLTGVNSGALSFGSATFTQGADDFFVAKLDGNGAGLWAQPFGGTGVEIPVAIATDAAGDVLVTGTFDANLDLSGNQLSSAGGRDIFVAKLDKDGNLLWSKGFGTAGDQVVQGIAVEPTGEVVLTGSFTGDLSFGGPTLSSAGGDDVFMAKLAADGTHIWSKSFGGSNDQAGLAVAVDGAGNIFIAGTFRGDVDFAGGLTLTTPGDRDIFVAAFGPDGSHLWSAGFGDDNDQVVDALALAPDGAVLLTGGFFGTLSFGAGAADLGADGKDVFIAALEGLDGSHRWSRRFGGAGDQSGQSLAVDSAGGVTLSGDFQQTLDWGVVEFVSAGQEDIFLARLSLINGVPITALRFGDGGSQVGPTHTAVSVTGEVHCAGGLQGSVDFGGSALTSAGANDLFVAKLSP